MSPLHRFALVSSLCTVVLLGWWFRPQAPSGRERSQTSPAQDGDDWFTQAVVLSRLPGPLHLTLAVEHYQCAAQKYRDEGDPLSAARADNLAGLLCYRNGRYEPAERLFRAALQVRRRAEDREGLAQSTSNLALIYLSAGTPNRALPLLKESASWCKAAGNRRQLAITLNNLGGAYDQMDLPADALRYYQQSLQLSADFDDADGNESRAWAGNNIGVTLNYLNDLPRAEQWLTQTLEQWRVLQNTRGEALTRNNLGWTRRLQGRPEAALALHRQAYQLSEDPRVRAFSIHNQGLVHYEQKQWDQARRCFQAGLKLRCAGGDERGSAYSLYSLACVAAAQNETIADQLFQDAAHLATQQKDVGLQTGIRVDHAEFLKRQNRPEEAWRAVEDAVALIENQRGLMPFGDFRARYLAARLRAYQLRIQWLLTDHRQQATSDSALGALFALEAATARALRDRLNRGEPTEDGGFLRHQTQGVTARQGAVPPAPARAAWLQNFQTKLAADEQIVRIHLDEPHSGAWLITRDHWSFLALPPRSLLAKQIPMVVQQMRRPPTLFDNPNAAQRLSETLWQPIAPHITRARLILILDPILQAVPFAALPFQKKLLIDHYELVHLPSLNDLKPTQARQAKAQGKALLFADSRPKLVPDLAEATQNQTAMANLVAAFPPVNTATTRSPTAGLTPLLHARREAETIQTILGPARCTLLTGEAARPSYLQNHHDVENAFLLHFAVHATANSEHPEQTGLYLSQENGEKQNHNGFIPLNHIYNLKLNAEWVVLSGCETASGQALAGEGTLSLARAFLLAGAEKVVASQWRVADEATAELMQEFYRAKFSQGQSGGQALRQAQQKLRNQKRWAVPYYWAAFTVYGR